ncbi:MAG TPA: DUF4942 domain-containing protein [Reyranella sp.]|nr:DUF4942 domain-containing protein [Reyranella sp.]
MNAPATIGANIVPRATIRDICGRRQKALDLFDAAHGQLVNASGALDAAKLAYACIDPRHSPSTASPESSYTYSTRRETDHFLDGLQVPPLEAFRAEARKMVDRRMWATIVEMTDLERLMDKEAKDQLRDQLLADVPEATEENVVATLQDFAANAGRIWRRGIANCFSRLDRRFRSHDGWKIGSRVILSHMFDGFGHWNYHRNHRDTLYDIDRVFCLLDGRESPHLLGGIAQVVEESRKSGGWGGRQSECESEYFKIRCFKNGNCHIWFKRDDLVARVNRLLGEYYGDVIPEERNPDPDTGLHEPKLTPAKRLGFFPTPEAVASTVIEGAQLYRPKDEPPLVVLEPSAGTGNLAYLAADQGCVVDCIEIDGVRASALRHSRRFRRVQMADFLSIAPRPIYDRVVMNPPFDRERDIDHVVHALKFLKPGGCLVAVMSAGTEFRETRKARGFREMVLRLNGQFHDLPEGSFSSVGTDINTIVVRVWADGRKQWGWR